MRVTLAILIAIEICLLALPFASYGIDSPAMGRAWYNWQRTPTAENEQVWKKERQSRARMSLVVDCLYLGFLVCNTSAIVATWSRILRSGRIQDPKAYPVTNPGKEDGADSC